MKKLQSTEIHTAALFDLSEVEFYDKLGEGKLE
jgi:hypothetical protein